MKPIRKFHALTACVLATALLAGCTPAHPRAQRYGAPAPAPAPAPAAPAPDTVRTAPPAPAPDTAAPMREAQNIANSLVGKHNISRANVFVTDRTAYVVVNIPNLAHGALTDQIKNDVANTVRQVDPSIDRVFVSADPDVFERFQGYSNDIRAGRPVAGIYDRFAELVRRVWPQAR
ncbi:YhcN/YlaJ family sporulation lipoprotein [Effusibacillus pohliae]|uniref:YhcN/YlaJ family sporulation lipoprotein n=1 Tax=Effusibacillus pohliae TaxID=232270 RepID=UPI00036A6E12|nr:YhcN/YlaJ family sporulation lipoprotein [Effusibacillus pohliae]